MPFPGALRLFGVEIVEACACMGVDQAERVEPVVQPAATRVGAGVVAQRVDALVGADDPQNVGDLPRGTRFMRSTFMTSIKSSMSRTSMNPPCLNADWYNS